MGWNVDRIGFEYFVLPYERPTDNELEGISWNTASDCAGTNSNRLGTTRVSSYFMLRGNSNSPFPFLGARDFKEFKICWRSDGALLGQGVSSF